MHPGNGTDWLSQKNSLISRSWPQIVSWAHLEVYPVQLPVLVLHLRAHVLGHVSEVSNHGGHLLHVLLHLLFPVVVGDPGSRSPNRTTESEHTISILGTRVFSPIWHWRPCSRSRFGQKHRVVEVVVMVKVLSSWSSTAWPPPPTPPYSSSSSSRRRVVNHVRMGNQSAFYWWVPKRDE